ncbi:hypothetical protein ACLBOM_17960 [Escherichia coli]
MGAYYSDAACEVINAIYNDKRAEHWLISRIMGILIIFRQARRSMTCKLATMARIRHIHGIYAFYQ